MENQGEIILYQPDKEVKLEVRLENETVWLNRQQLAELFARDVKTIGKHIHNALKEELADMATVAKFAIVQSEGGRTVTRQIEFYNLDIQKHNSQYPRIEVKTYKQCHDRFLIIDDTDVYHIGASLKDLGKKMFAFSKLDIPSKTITDLL